MSKRDRSKKEKEIIISGEEAYKILYQTMNHYPRIMEIIKELYRKKWEGVEYNKKGLMVDFIDRLKKRGIDNPISFGESIIEMLITSFVLGNVNREHSLRLGFIKRNDETELRGI